MNAIVGFDPLDVQSLNEPVPDYTTDLDVDMRGLRLGVERDYFFYKDVSPEYRSAVEEAMRELEKLGVVFVDVKIPELDLCAGIFLNIIATDTSAYHRRWLREKPNDYVQGTRIMLEFGELLFGTDYLMAQRAREVLRSAIKDTFRRERLDGLIGPSNVVTAVHMSRYSSSLFEGSPEDSTGALHQLSVANVVGVPSMSVPCGFTAAGLPVGFVLYGRPFDESLLLRIGHAYGKVTPWTARAPQLKAAAVR
jgi:aspartyl-tRNA(Asn)/glutamyl-tRNA(Gln) amidotransferase subunit A